MHWLSICRVLYYSRSFFAAWVCRLATTHCTSLRCTFNPRNQIVWRYVARPFPVCSCPRTTYILNRLGQKNVSWTSYGKKNERKLKKNKIFLTFGDYLCSFPADLDAQATASLHESPRVLRHRAEGHACGARDRRTRNQGRMRRM